MLIVSLAVDDLSVEKPLLSQRGGFSVAAPPVGDQRTSGVSHFTAPINFRL